MRKIGGIYCRNPLQSRPAFKLNEKFLQLEQMVNIVNAGFRKVKNWQ